MVSQNLKDRLVDALVDVPGTDMPNERSALMTGIPPNIRGSLTRSSSQYIDFVNMIDQLERLGRLDNGERPLIIIAHNAGRATRNTDLGKKFREIEAELETAYGGDSPSSDIPEIPERIVYLDFSHSEKG